MVDLRSDTVTQPTDAMREAMSLADVGDDDYGEDATVNRLQGLAAGRLGKEAALFLPSGTMANLIALLTHTQPGDEVIVECQAHIYLDEAGGMSALAGVIPRPVAGERGTITAAQLEAVLRPPDPHYAPTRLLCLENTHNSAGGTVMTPTAMAEVCGAAHRRGLRVHLDGARIFNAAVALGVDVRHLASDADSVMFCLSKGLSAPAGSVLLGEAGFVARARRLRKMLGGGMRQVGVLAAAGIVALETMVERLEEDHRHAKLLARRLAALPGLGIDPASVQTNIIMVHVADAPRMAQHLAARNVLANAEGPKRIRLVTHRHIGAREIDEAVDGFHEMTSLTELHQGLGGSRDL
jgi:threonine aldolase